MSTRENIQRLRRKSSSRAALNLFLLTTVAGISSANAALDVSKLPPAATHQVNFATDIKPIFEQSCLRCHGATKPKSGFRLDNRESALKGGEHGTAINPGDSKNSALIHYIAGIDPDMLMPPEGKGESLTTNQIALLRAWIDQGAEWDESESLLQLSVAPAVSYISASGNESKFREHWWQRDGWRSGVESFSFTDNSSPDVRITLSGRAITDDYRADLLVEKLDLGFFHSGFEQFRKYDSDVGGYYPLFSQPSFSLDQNLYLDIGRLWVDFGLTLPDWPRLVLGYEYQYRNGDKATLQWGTVNEGDTYRAIYPAYKSIDERTHILKFDAEFERNGWRVEDSFRGEWTELNTRNHNVNITALDTPGLLILDQSQQGWQSFQGANTVRVERKFKDWLFASAGYLYSHLSGDADFTLDTFNPFGTPLTTRVLAYQWHSDHITLERESHVGNINMLLGPWQGATLILAAQSEWTRQDGTTEGFEDTIGAPSFADDSSPVSHYSNLDRMAVDESMELQYTRLPFTTLYAQARLQQESIGHDENVSSQQTFMRDTDADSDTYDLRAGFDTSPWSWLKFGSFYRWRDKSTDYDDGFADYEPGDIFGYPTVISERDWTSQEIQTQLTLRPCRWLKTTLTHRLVTTRYHTETEPVSVIAFGDATPGGTVLAGNYDAQIFSANFTLTPWARLHLFASASYQDIRSKSNADYSDAVVPYDGNIWSVLCHGRYALTKKTDLVAGYTFSAADFSQDNYATGLPLGMDYDLHGAQIALVSHCTKNLTTKLQYGFYHYDEPSSGGANDYTAHAVFVSLNLQFN